ncbi:MAG: hypothetical protein JKX69_00685 [Rhodobacteraceae bacterium]|nr:hypothetical protein [Paracoccaceae bacterium]
MRKIVTEDEFEKLAGRIVPIQRDTKIFDGDAFECCCGESHIFRTGMTIVTHEGINGRFILLCNANKGEVYMVLIKTKLKLGFMYKGLELLGGIRVDPSPQ